MNRQMPVNKVLLGALALFIIILLALSFITSNPRYLTGRITLIQPTQWALQADWQWYRPLAQRRYRLVNLPADFQQVDRRVKGTWQVVEVTGNGQWETFLMQIYIQNQNISP